MDITIRLEVTDTSVPFSESSNKQSSFFWITGFKSSPSERFQVVDLYAEEISGTWYIKGTIFNEVPDNATTSVIFTVYYTYFYTPIIEPPGDGNGSGDA